MNKPVRSKKVSIMAEQKKQASKDLLYSSDEKQVLQKIEQLRELGTDSDLITLAEVYTENKSENIKRAIHQFFCDLRNQSSVEVIARIIKTAADKETLKMVVSSTWESRLNYIGYFELFIDLVVHEDFDVAFEAFTLIESFEEKTTEARKQTLIEYAKKKITKCKEGNLSFAVDLVKIIEAYKVDGEI